MVTRAVVLAHRLVLEGGSELSSARVALLRRTLSSLAQIGVTECCVVDGEHADVLQERLVGAGTRFEGSDMRVQVLANRSWRRATGSALLVARDFLTRAPGEPCLVLRGDRPLAAEALAELAATELGRFAAAIVVAEPPTAAAQLAPLHDEVKVRLDARRSGRGPAVPTVVSLGLDLDRYDAIFTGHALVSTAIAAELERWSNPSLEDALVAWVAAGRVRARPGRIAWPWDVARPADAAHMDDKVAAILDAKSHPAYTLLNPGPVNTTPGV